MQSQTPAKMIFVNLPVTDLARSEAVYAAAGFVKDPRFSNEMAVGMAFSDTIHVMLLSHDFFRNFTAKPIANAEKSCQVLLCLSADDRAGVDAMVEQTVAAGARPDPCPTQDYGHMYGRSWEDPDGHIWEVMWMDLEAFLPSQSQLDQVAAPARELQPA